MSAVSFSLILTGVLLNAAAQLLLKAGANAVGRFAFTLANALPIGMRFAVEPHVLSDVACYVASLVVWIMALSRVDVSIAYPMLSIGYVVNALAAWYLFGEAVTPMRVAGIAIIILGVFIVARS
jgi:multidrug transporter EmrE-like cation transporter